MKRPPIEHVLKVWTPYWDALASGAKNFEVRRDDRGFLQGDILVLRKSDGEGFLGGELRRRVSYILPGGQFGIEHGFVVMGLQNVE